MEHQPLDKDRRLKDTESTSLFNKVNVDDQKWFELFTSGYYSVIEEYWNSRISILSKENEVLSESMNFDNLSKIGANLARIKEIKTFFNRVDSKKRKLVKK